MPIKWIAQTEELEGAVRIPDLYESGLLSSSARIFVGNKTYPGISHLAAAVGTPVLALFRTTDPRVWAPRGLAVNVVRQRVPELSSASGIGGLPRCAESRPPGILYLFNKLRALITGRVGGEPFLAGCHLRYQLRWDFRPGKRRG